MHTSLFFKLFPPPKFLIMKHAGLDISDDAIHCLEYSGKAPNFRISKFSSTPLPKGTVEAGEIRDEKALVAILSNIDHDLKLSYVKVAVPEEKSYLFQTDISTTDPLAIAQNVEFKLEENVPMPASDSLFYFDILPMAVTGGKLRATVSVVPRVYVEQMVNVLRQSGITPIAFEVVPKSISKAVLPLEEKKTVLLVQIMNNKTGIYIVSGGVVCFTSTVSWGSAIGGEGADPSVLTQEIDRIYNYWLSHNVETSKIGEVVVVGREASKYQSVIESTIIKYNLAVAVGNVWTNIFSVDKYVPPILKEDSLDYAVAAGLALDLK
jgi:Tfp pilus assembly PilM family ATPase